MRCGPVCPRESLQKPQVQAFRAWLLRELEDMPPV
jgi:hypothetical protein